MALHSHRLLFRLAWLFAGNCVVWYLPYKRVRCLGPGEETVVTILRGFVQSEVQRGRGEGQVWSSEFNLNETSSTSTYINYWTEEQGASKNYSEAL